jgi:putative endonuclease
MYYEYFAKSVRNNKIYVGRTEKDPVDRIKDHNSGSNRWSRYNKPLKLVYYESFKCKTDAIQREYFYKTGVGKRVKYAIVREFDK